MREDLELYQQIMAGLREAASTGKTPAFVFDRISDKPMESKSLEFQGAHSKRYVSDANLFAIFHFSVTESGWSSKDRRIFNQMIDLAEKFGVKDLVFKNTDRLSRNLRDLLRIQDLIEKKGYKIHFFENHQVISKASNYNDKWNLELLILVAKRLSDKISHDMQVSNQYKTERRIAPGKARLGYIYDKEKRMHLIDPTKEAEMRWLFDEFDSGKHSLADFVALVNAKGVKNLWSKKWHKSRLYDLLTSPFYHGEFVTTKDGTVNQGNHEPYYDKDRYIKRITRLNKRFFPRKGIKHDFLLGGLLYCSCGGRYFADLKKNKFVYYAHPCQHLNGKYERLNEKDFFQLIDAAIRQVAMADTFTEALKEVFKSRIKERNSNKQQDLLFLTNKLLELNRKKDRLFELYAEEGIDKVSLTAKIREYDHEIGQLKKQESTLSINQKDFIFKVAEVIEEFKNFPRTYESATHEYKARLLQKSVKRITKDGPNVHLGFTETFRILYRPELKTLEAAVRNHPGILPKQDSNLRHGD